MPGLRTDGCDYEQGDCKESEAAHGMNPLMDDTEPVSTEFPNISSKDLPQSAKAISRARWLYAGLDGARTTEASVVRTRKTKVSCR